MERTRRIETIAIPIPQVFAVLCCWDFARFCSFACLSALVCALLFFSLIWYSFSPLSAGNYYFVSEDFVSDFVSAGLSAVDDPDAFSVLSWDISSEAEDS